MLSIDHLGVMIERYLACVDEKYQRPGSFVEARGTNDGMLDPQLNFFINLLGGLYSIPRFASEMKNVVGWKKGSVFVTLHQRQCDGQMLRLHL